MSTEVRKQHGQIAPPNAVYRVPRRRPEPVRPPLHARSFTAKIVVATMQAIGITLPGTGATSTVDHSLSTLTTLSADKSSHFADLDELGCRQKSSATQGTFLKRNDPLLFLKRRGRVRIAGISRTTHHNLTTMFLLQTILLLLTSLLHPTLSSPLQHPGPTSHLTISTTTLNTTTPNLRLSLSLLRPYQFLPIWGVSETLNAAIQTARASGLDNRLPPQGFRIALDGVSLHAYPTYMEYTWGLLLLTLKQVEEDLGVKGNLACQWDLVEVEEGGREGRIWGRGSLERDLGRRGRGRGIVGEV
ncbi:MAG: hypothetical protein Q9176_002915 [Flavoplaca citrina]